MRDPKYKNPKATVRLLLIVWAIIAVIALATGKWEPLFIWSMGVVYGMPLGAFIEISKRPPS
jgi:hypothetical protein